jgi:hypothetical protein
MMTAPDTELAAEFLETWKAGGPWPLCAFHENKKGVFGTFTSDMLDEMAAWLVAQQDDERNIYFHVNSVRQPEHGKAAKTDVLRMDYFHVDMDPVKGRDLREEQKRILADLQTTALLPKPTVITFSGGGYQAFWKLAESIELSGEVAKIEEAERYNVQIAKLLAADNCHNADRIMRLPGTINWPNKAKRDNGQTPVMALVIRQDWTLAYDPANPEHFMKAPDLATSTRVGSKNQIQVNVSGNCQRIAAEVFGDEQGMFKDVSSRARVAIIQGKDPDQPLTNGNSRSDWLWHVACELVRHDFDDDTIYSIITDPDLGISEHVLTQGNAANQHRCALRTIQRAREFAVEPWLEQLNQEYALIESLGGKMRIACERFSEAEGRYKIEFHQKDGFTTMWSNQTVLMMGKDQKGNPLPKAVPVGKWWLQHANRRTYRDVVFYPNRDFPDSMNLWRGFAVNALPGDCSLFLDHVKNVLCRGNEEHYAWMVKWMANAVQNPDKPGQVAIVLRGGQGTGKGTFAKMLGKLFGGHYKYVNNSKHVTGQFNSMLKDAVLVFADECFVANDPASESALKSLITEENIRTEQKNIDNMESRNCVHLIMATNKEWAVAADQDDRRFFVVEIDDKYQTSREYFAPLYAQMENGGYEALMHFLLTYDLAGFDAYSACPKTTELRKQQDQSMDEMSSFLLHALEEGRLSPTHSGWRTRVLKEELVERFKVENPSFRRNPNRSLGIFLSRFDVLSTTGNNPETWTDARGQKRATSNRPKIWVFPALDECRKLWEAVTKSGSRTWPAVGDDNQDEGSTEPPEDGGDAF